MSPADCQMSTRTQERETANTPALYVVATPLGNLGDITERAVEILRSADVIAAEDTRHTRNLLRHLGISKPLIAAHEHNEQEAASRLVANLEHGASVALVSDAGTPAVSDPGARIVARVRAAGFRVVPVPGANAAITALSASGRTDAHFLFYGFLPAKRTGRRQELEKIKTLPYLLVFYEAPHRVIETVEDLAEVLGGERQVVIARELTKAFESIDAMSLAEASTWLAAEPKRQRGEFVLVVEGASGEPISEVEARRVLEALLEELSLKQAVKLAARLTGVSRNRLYEIALKIRNAGE